MIFFDHVVLELIPNTETSPAVNVDGVSHVTSAEDVGVTATVVSPNRTLLTSVKYEPIIDTVCPPVIDPELGSIDVIIGVLDINYVNILNYNCNTNIGIVTRILVMSKYQVNHEF